LLKLLLEVAMPKARRFRREIRARRAAATRLRNHEVMITKRPRDIVELPRIRELYARRRTQLRIIVTIRDPRDILTSRHVRTARERPYHVTIPEWNHRYRHVVKHLTDPDVMVARYEDLVANTGSIESRMESFIGEHFEQAFSSFVDRVPPGFRTTALNGLRRIDARSVGRWKRPEHRDRIAHVLRRLPDFPHQLVRLGYEQDSKWVRRWQLAVENRERARRDALAG
jgi:hypothetical protein